MGNSAQCYVAAGMGGEFGEKWIHAHVWLRVPALFTQKHHNIVNWLHANTKLKVKKKKSRSVGYVAKRPEFNDSFKPS